MGSLQSTVIFLHNVVTTLLLFSSLCTDTDPNFITLGEGQTSQVFTVNTEGIGFCESWHITSQNGPIELSVTGTDFRSLPGNVMRFTDLIVYDVRNPGLTSPADVQALWSRDAIREAALDDFDLNEPLISELVQEEFPAFPALSVSSFSVGADSSLSLETNGFFTMDRQVKIDWTKPASSFLGFSEDDSDDGSDSFDPNDFGAGVFSAISGGSIQSPPGRFSRFNPNDVTFPTKYSSKGDGLFVLASAQCFDLSEACVIPDALGAEILGNTGGLAVGVNLDLMGLPTLIASPNDDRRLLQFNLNALPACPAVSCEGSLGFSVQVDECPEDPEKSAPGLCGCGQADVDNDNDGRCDANNQEDICFGDDSTGDEDGDGFCADTDMCDAPGQQHTTSEDFCPCNLANIGTTLQPNCVPPLGVVLDIILDLDVPCTDELINSIDTGALQNFVLSQFDNSPQAQVITRIVSLLREARCTSDPDTQNRRALASGSSGNQLVLEFSLLALNEVQLRFLLDSPGLIIFTKFTGLSSILNVTITCYTTTSSVISSSECDPSCLACSGPAANQCLLCEPCDELNTNNECVPRTTALCSSPTTGIVTVD